MSVLTASRTQTSTDDLADWRKDPRVAELNRKKVELDRAARKLAAEADSAEHRLSDAEAAVEPLEIDIMAGITSDPKALDKARAKVVSLAGELAAARDKVAANA